MKSLRDAESLYDEVKHYMQKGRSRHAALLKIGKDLKTFRNIEPIIQLKVTKQAKFAEVRHLYSDDCVLTFDIHTINVINTFYISTFMLYRYTKNGRNKLSTACLS